MISLAAARFVMAAGSMDGSIFCEGEAGAGAFCVMMTVSGLPGS
jgi:hypothetical protein